MSVSFDSRFEKGFGGGPGSPVAFLSNAGDVTGTVTANSNRVLIAAVCADVDIGTPTMSWNSVAMTDITGSWITSGTFRVRLFGLKNPAAGNLSLSCSFTPTGTENVVIGAWSLFDADQTTGWQNSGSDTGTGTSVSGTVTSANGNMAVAALLDQNATSATITSGTSDWNERDLNGNYNAGHLASSSGSTILSWTLGSSVAWALAKVDVIAVSAGNSSSVSPSVSPSASVSKSPSLSPSPSASLSPSASQSPSASVSPSSAGLVIMERVVFDYVD